MNNKADKEIVDHMVHVCMWVISRITTVKSANSKSTTQSYKLFRIHRFNNVSG